MSRYFRIIVAEIVFSTFLIQILLPYSVFASSSDEVPLEDSVTSSSEVGLSPQEITLSGADTNEVPSSALTESPVLLQSQERIEDIQIQQQSSFDKKTDVPQSDTRSI